MTYHHLFDTQSEIYAQSRPQYPQALYDHLVGLCQEKRMAWDCACGNGQVAVDLANYFQRVYATDVSQEQINNAIKKSRIRYDVGLAEATPFNDNVFDLVCVAQALHWLDFHKFWPEVKRVLKNGGIFAAWGYSFFTIEKRIQQVIETTFFDTIQPYWPDRNRLLWDHYRDVPFPFEKMSTPNIPLVMVWTLDELFAYLLSWSPTQRCIADQGDGFLRVVYQEMNQVWGDPNTKQAIEMDFCLVVGRNEI